MRCSSNQELASSLSMWPKLSAITLPDISLCGDGEFEDCVSHAEDTKVCTEVVARRLFKSSYTLDSITFVTIEEARRNPDVVERCVWCAEREVDGSVARLVWCEKDDWIQKSIDCGEYACHEEEEDVQAFLDRNEDLPWASQCLTLYGSA
jgi:hypothetical protein